MTNAEIINELNKIIATLKGEEKKTRKFYEYFDSCVYLNGFIPNARHSKDYAKSAIDAVIECYEEWEQIAREKFIGTFPEYLKEKML